MGISDSRSGAGLHARRRARRLLALSGLILALAGCTAGQKPVAAPEPSYGSLPSYLPTTSIQPDSVLTGTVDRPALTTEGDSVTVAVAGATVLATVSGPEVPGEGLPYQTPSTTCTWTVTLTGATAAVPLAVTDFTTIDHLGQVYHPTLVAGQPALPASLARGQTVTVKLRTVMTVGEGLMRWAPDGTHVVASWDFEVEND